ncbi:hypothetical protein CCAX7_29970 [Capsulimonas corticalis]|uniref:Uncharacterized protein n=1 Tax=Capsulimonas corticalis TaxID=2219043 RepID=A0A402CSW4_9BACT|nr:hypothetical protein [Capsulimonas corticalis]BDI30946.1 hypothetical protein CCAX7_29970 [Capsulimonas corticalis]
MAQVNRFSEALKEGANLVGLASASALSVALLSPLPILVGLAAEAAYLLFIPDTKWYGGRLAQREETARRRRSQQFRVETLPQLQEDTQARFTHLELVQGQIYAQAQTDQKWFGEMLRKLDFLLEKFLIFALKELHFRNYLLSIWEECQSDRSRPSNDIGRQRSSGGGRPNNFASSRFSGPPVEWVPRVVKDVQGSYDGDMENLTRLRDDESDLNTKAVLEKRIDVLKQRHEFVGKIGRILTNLNYQMELLEDTFGLINDQIRARSPEQVLSDIEGVVYQTESMTQLLDELAPFEQMTAGVG